MLNEDVIRQLANEFAENNGFSSVINGLRDRVNPPILCNAKRASGVYLGASKTNPNQCYAKPPNEEGNVLVIGGSGAGKGRYIVKPTIETWTESCFVIDIKGENYKHVIRRMKDRNVDSDGIILVDPYNSEGCHYDPYSFLDRASPHFDEDVEEMVTSIVPMPENANDPYWIFVARGILKAGIIYCYDSEMDFAETMVFIGSMGINSLCKKIKQDGSCEAKSCIRNISMTKEDQQALYGSDLDNYIRNFITNPFISEFLSRTDKAKMINWEEICNSSIPQKVFLKIDESRLSSWSCVIRLMVTQLIRHLERQIDISETGFIPEHPFMILLDEFPRLGKMECIQSALNTLRSKGVTIVLIVQSFSQLDKYYGTISRKVMIDNFKYLAILNIRDPETQYIISRMIGTQKREKKRCIMAIQEEISEAEVRQIQIDEIREPIVEPHTLAYLKDILLITPDGLVEAKRASYEDIMKDSGCKVKVGRLLVPPKL